MTDFQIRSDNVDVEQIMRQIRARIREKRGVDYTEDEIKELARVKLEKFLDPTGVRSDLLAQFRERNTGTAALDYDMEESPLFHSARAFVRFVRKLLRPILKLFFNSKAITDAIHLQAEAARRENLQYELIHNLVVETTRLGIQVKNLKMQVESTSSRLDFDERRARALEGVVQYRPGTVPPLQPPAGSARESKDEGSQERRTRRRRRRGRRPASARDASGGSYGEPGSASPRDGSGASYGEASASAGGESNAGYSERRAESGRGAADSGAGSNEGGASPGGSNPSE
jgi:hypothetical protein